MKTTPRATKALTDCIFLNIPNPSLLLFLIISLRNRHTRIRAFHSSGLLSRTARTEKIALLANTEFIHKSFTSAVNCGCAAQQRVWVEVDAGPVMLRI